MIELKKGVAYMLSQPKNIKRFKSMDVLLLV